MADQKTDEQERPDELPHSVKFPLIESKTPVTVRSMTNAEIEDLLDE